MIRTCRRERLREPCLNSFLPKDLNTWPFECLEHYPKAPSFTMAYGIYHLQHDTSSPWQHCSTKTFNQERAQPNIAGASTSSDFPTRSAIDISKKPVNFIRFARVPHDTLMHTNQSARHSVNCGSKNQLHCNKNDFAMASLQEPLPSTNLTMSVRLPSGEKE